MAAAHAISDVYIRTRADSGRTLTRVDLQTLHRALMENVLYGYDVLASAVHLTAATLALLAPEVAFVRMNLYVMPLGIDGNTPRLGSLDFLKSRQLTTQMSLDYSHAETMRSAASGSHAVSASVPELDLCVMNPPFTRSVGGNLLFGSLPDERGRLQVELKKWAKNLPANVTAGLASVFVALADKLLKMNGRLAFVLPAAVLSGEAWVDTRKLISRRYHLETVIASHDADRPNFSENTDLSEILFIARKRREADAPNRTTYINLWRNPRSLHEALDLANRITGFQSVTSIEDPGVTSIRSASAKLGEMVSTPAPASAANWTGALFAQTDLLRAYWSLEQGQLVLPGESLSQNVSMCRVAEIGELGPDRRRVHEGFQRSDDDLTPYPAFWNHDAQAVQTLRQVPNLHLKVWHDSPRGSDYGPHLWRRAAKLLLAERLRFNTQRLTAVGLDTLVLSNTWWPLKTKDLSSAQEKALLLWLNSTLAILLCFGRRVITEGAFVSLKQPAWAAMPVLDVRRLTKKKLLRLGNAYDHLSQQVLQPLAQLSIDATRQAIDDALGEALGLPSLTHLRALMAREPGLSARAISGPLSV